MHINLRRSLSLEKQKEELESKLDKIIVTIQKFMKPVVYLEI